MIQRVSFLVLLLLRSLCIFGQSMVNGIVVNDVGNGIEGVDITNNMDINTISTKDGNFSFTMPVDSAYVVLYFTKMGYKTKHLKIYNGECHVIVVLSNSEMLDEVMVRPAKYGRFSNYEAQITKMNSFEIKTNPNALGDVIGGMKVLPGVQSNDNDGRLIILGGDTDESAIYIDGLINFNPYTMMQKNVSVRSRFSPDLFSGVTLQSTGFSAAYGNAMSGILHLDSYNTNQMVSKTDLNISTTGIESSFIRANTNFACRLNGSYMNMLPYYSIVNTDYDVNKAYNNIACNYFMTNQISNKSVIKTNVYYNRASVNYSYNNIDDIKMTNNVCENNFSGSVISDIHISSYWDLYLGANIAYYNFSTTDAWFKNDSVYYKKVDSHAKLALSYHKDKIKNTFGAENVYSSFDEDYILGNKYKLKYHNSLISVYDELSVFISDRINLNCGVRYEYATYIKKQNVAPRLYASYKLNKSNIFSLSSGLFYQLPKQDVLGYTKNITFRNAFSSTFTYSYVKNNSKFQVDLYYKNYKALTTYDKTDFYYNNFKDNGFGRVWGANLFLKNTIHLFEYWLSYSYLDAKILSDLHHTEVMPDYLSHNRFSVTGKYWISALRSMLGASFYIDDGATFYKNNDASVARKSPYRSRTDLSWSYLPTKNIIIHLSCQNILGRRNVYGYEYSSSVPNKERPVVSPERRFFYIGVFITFSKNNINQLKSL